MTDQTHQFPATLRPLREIVDEYDAKAAAIPAEIEAFGRAITSLEVCATIGGAYAGRVVDASKPYERNLRANLLQSAWKHVYAGLNIDKIASASDRKRFEMAMSDPPPFTLDNIAATFGGYVKDPRFHILKGLAECFGELDPAFKSHQKVKVGVAGLPKRIIIGSVGGYGHGYGADKLRDTLKALAAFEGQPHPEYSRVSNLIEQARRDTVEFDGMKLNVYQNGNAHLAFGPEKLRAINLALAEFYGEVLPDTPDEDPEEKRERDLFRSREVSKDLQFYPTPDRVADTVVAELGLRDSWRVLEPSCGDGQLLDAVRRYADKERISVRGLGIEVQPDLAAKTKAKGYSVFEANFLEVAPPETEDKKFDAIVMNPPFYGTHWKKHVLHARRFLKQDGRAICILPASAMVDGHLEEMGLVSKGRYGWRDRWSDLPTASFHESGTNVATGYLTFFAKRD